MEPGVTLLKELQEHSPASTKAQNEQAHVLSPSTLSTLFDALRPKSLLSAKIIGAAREHFQDNPYQNIWIGIDKSALEHNAKTLRAVAPDKKLCAVLKADAYGHGISLVAPVLAPHVDTFGITENYEARAIRAQAPSQDKPVMRVRLADAFEMSDAIASNLNIQELVGSHSQAEMISNLSMHEGTQPTAVHLSLDSAGMGRDGLNTNDEAWSETLTEIKAMLDLPGIKIVGICGHMPVADVPCARTLGIDATAFVEKVNHLKLILPEISDVHLFASGSTLRFQSLPKHIQQAITMNRAGGALFGHKSYFGEDLSRLRHAMNVCTFVTGVFERPPGTTVGYGSHYQTQKWERHAHVPGGWAIFPREALLAQASQGGLSRLTVMNEHGGAHAILGNPSMNSVICLAHTSDGNHQLAPMEPVFLLASPHQMDSNRPVQTANTIGDILGSTGARVSVHLGSAKNAAKIMIDD